MKKLIFTLFCLSTLSFAGEVNYPLVKLETTDQNLVQVERCFGENMCMAVGVYPLESFDSKPGLRKARSITTMVIEAAALAASYFVTGFWNYGTRSDLNVFISEVLILGGEVTAFLVIKPINPFYQWKLANLEAATQQEDLIRGPIIIECKTDKEMNKVVALIKELHE